MIRLRHISATILLLASVLATSGTATAQGLDRIDRERFQYMLRNVYAEVKKNYYDPNFKGVDLEARVKQAEEKLRAASTPGQARSAVAWAFDGLDDAHTRYFPPESTANYEYGWRMEMLGDACFVTAVRPGSDAEKQGVKPGDEILKLNGYRPTRADLGKMRYFFNVLQPQPALRLELRSPDGTVRTVSPLARMRQGKHMLESNNALDVADLERRAQNDERARASRWVEMGPELMIWNMPDFGILPDAVDGIMAKAREHKALIIDMRGNPGGYVITENRLVSHFFENDVKILERAGRKEKAKDLKTEIAKSRGSGKIFTGKLIVLVSSSSASAAEIFARVVQLEKRGTVIGDTTSGHVMESISFQFELGGGGSERPGEATAAPVATGLGLKVFYWASITRADLIMSDGGRLEHVGVTPDERMLPTGADMAAGRDPVLAHAAELLGVKLSPDAAGKLFPVRWLEP